jgi:hypothetical protein
MQKNNSLWLLTDKEDTIKIEPITPNDMGIYRCKAINSRGFRYRDVSLTTSKDGFVDLFI